MYHIKPDRRSQSSASQIVAGLQECLKTTPLKYITVTDIYRATGISRATFYRLFDTPEDVLIYQLDQMTREAEALYETQEDRSSAGLLEATIAMGMRNHDFLKALVENGRHDLLFHYTESALHKLDAMQPFFSGGVDKPERDYIIAYLSMSMVATQITWARNGQKETAGDLIRYLRSYARVIGEMVGEE